MNPLDHFIRSYEQKEDMRMSLRDSVRKEINDLIENIPLPELSINFHLQDLIKEIDEIFERDESNDY